MNTDMNRPATYGRKQAPRQSDQAVVDGGPRQHMLRVYNYYMAVGLATTGLVAALGIPNPSRSNSPRISILNRNRSWPCSEHSLSTSI